MSESLKEVPSLDTLVSDPSLIDGLPLHLLKSLWVEVNGLEKALVLRILTAPTQDNGRAEAHTVEKWLTVDEVVSQFGVTVRWLYRHKRHLPHSQPTRKTILFPEERLRRWFAARKTN